MWPNKIEPTLRDERKNRKESTKMKVNKHASSNQEARDKKY